MASCRLPKTVKERAFAMCIGAFSTHIAKGNETENKHQTIQQFSFVSHPRNREERAGKTLLEGRFALPTMRLRRHKFAIEVLSQCDKIAIALRESLCGVAKGPLSRRERAFIARNFS
jgi:hypothetical protein